MSDYAVVTPVRNEADYLPELAASMISQSVRPIVWVLVDDGSTDGTAGIIEGLVDAHDWIRSVSRPDRGARAPGGGVVATFNAGFELVADEPWSFVVKLDADLSFESDYFERCLAEFANDERLGISGGEIADRLPDGSFRTDSHPDFHVRGATKIYRRECWKVIGGLTAAKGWDTIDEVKANQLGWSTRTLRHIRLQQQRTTGHRAGTWRDWAKNGRAAWFCGYHPLFAAARTLRVSGTRPYLVGGVAFAVGFGSAWLRRAPRVDDRELIRYLRREQLNRLVGRPSIWR